MKIPTLFYKYEILRALKRCINRLKQTTISQDNEEMLLQKMLNLFEILGQNSNDCGSTVQHYKVDNQSIKSEASNVLNILVRLHINRPHLETRFEMKSAI